MEQIKTTLLISDDLDDHQSFTEAFQKVAPSMVVVAVLSQEKALTLLSSRKLVPDYIFLDLTSPDSDVTKFLANVKREENGKEIRVTVYGGEENLSDDHPRGILKFDKDYDFPQLIAFIENLMRKKNS